jgi:hypothetical protein
MAPAREALKAGDVKSGIPLFVNAVDRKKSGSDGLDPNNITYDALFIRLLKMCWPTSHLHVFALVGGIFLIATLLMHTMVPLRIANMAGCTFFFASGALSGNVATFILYLLLLPINGIRRRQMLNLIKRARIATEGDTSNADLRNAECMAMIRLQSSGEPRRAPPGPRGLSMLSVGSLQEIRQTFL